MINSIKTNFELFLYQRTVRVTFSILMFFSLGVSVFYITGSWGSFTSNLYHPASLSVLGYYTESYWLFSLLFPFLAVLPVGFSLCADQDEKTYPVYGIRIGRKKYYWGKYIAGFLVTVLVFALPLLIQLGINYLSFGWGTAANPSNIAPYSRDLDAVWHRYLFSWLYYNHRGICAVLHIMILSGFAGMAGVFTMAISSFIRHYAILLVLPFYLLVFLLREAGRIWCPEITTDVMDYFYLEISEAKDIRFIIGFFVGMWIISMAAMLVHIHKDYNNVGIR
ncbi:MAG: hypothetical protein PUB22_00095 [Clostridiales bacterium]|nr:hypothetical protein [Clostridiales bacterium]